jgi:hypothetical protein
MEGASDEMILSRLDLSKWDSLEVSIKEEV